MAEPTFDQADEVLKKAARDKADKETLAALGYDAENPVVLAHFQELQAKKADDKITHDELMRSLDKQVNDLADKQGRDAAKKQNEGDQQLPPVKTPGPQSSLETGPHSQQPPQLATDQGPAAAVRAAELSVPIGEGKVQSPEVNRSNAAKTPKQLWRPAAREVTGRGGPPNSPPIPEGKREQGGPNTPNPTETQPSQSQKQDDKIDWKLYTQDKEYRRQVNEQQKGQRQRQQQQRPLTAQRQQGR